MIAEIKSFNKKTGSIKGLLIVIIVGFLQYLLLSGMTNSSMMLPPYGVLEEGLIKNNLTSEIVWMIKDFSEGQFFGGLFSGIGVILGGIIAWRLDVKRSKFRGSDIVFGLNIFPWILASQIITIVFSVYALKYLSFIDGNTYHWVPTFLLIVGVPQAVLCVFGPSVKNLIVGCLLGAFTTVPIANYISYSIIDKIGMPVTIANYIALALSITFALQACKMLGFVKKVSFPIIKENVGDLDEEEKYEQLKSLKFIISKTLTSFTDCLFYGNEWPTIFLIIGAMIDWMINCEHGLLGAKVFPAILFAQLISGAIGAYLYGYKYIEKGWYPTYVPVVSICPFSILVFGPTLPVIIFSAIIGGIIGAPFAELLGKSFPEHIHGVVPNVLAMAVTTISVIAIMQGLPWF